jgi:hypothetical protein
MSGVVTPRETHYRVEFLDNEALHARWEDVERTLREVFGGAEYIDEGFTVERPIQYTRWGMEGRLGPGMKHFLVLNDSGTITGGFFCIATEREPGQTVVSEIGWVFVTSDVAPRTRLRIVNELIESAIDAFRKAGFRQAEFNFGTHLGSKSIGRRFGIVHAPTPENSNRWVKEL